MTEYYIGKMCTYIFTTDRHSLIEYLGKYPNISKFFTYFSEKNVSPIYTHSTQIVITRSLLSNKAIGDKISLSFINYKAKLYMYTFLNIVVQA